MDAEILVATRNLAVFEALDQRNIPYQAGLFTDEVVEALPRVRLVILDEADLVPLKYSTAALYGMLAQQGIPNYTSSQFLQAPDEVLAPLLKGQARKGSPLPPKRTIAFVAYSGGTGRTTLALDTALQFARATERHTEFPALLIEFTYGASALQALTGLQMPTLYELLTEVDQVGPTQFRGVTLLPMDYSTARDLSVEMVRGFLRKQISRHTLTVIDSQWPHGLLPAVRDQVDQWLVVTTPRVDAIVNAQRLAAELGEKAAIVLNQKGGLLDTLALSNLRRDLELPKIPRPDLFEGKRLGEQVLRWLYGKQPWTKIYHRPRRWWEKLLGRRRSRP